MYAFSHEPKSKVLFICPLESPLRWLAGISYLQAFFPCSYPLSHQMPPPFSWCSSNKGPWFPSLLFPKPPLHPTPTLSPPARFTVADSGMDPKSTLWFPFQFPPTAHQATGIPGRDHCGSSSLPSLSLLSPQNPFFTQQPKGLFENPNQVAFFSLKATGGFPLHQEWPLIICVHHGPGGLAAAPPLSLPPCSPWLFFARNAHFLTRVSTRPLHVCHDLGPQIFSKLASFCQFRL